MGVVYRARHVILNKHVAIKVLRKAHDEAAWKRFVQEAQTASSVNHYNVVGISDFGVISGHAYLVMELMEGQTLTDIINQGPVDPLRVCRIGAQIARGLQAVHDKGVVHRDLKPDNIFLVEREGKQDVVKIVDFGLAKSEAGQRLTQDGTVVGTAEYISPEQVTGQDTDPRSDQYSLGCILYEMLTSQLPFEGESTATLIYKHVYKNPITPRKVRPEMSIPPSLEAVVLKCMAKKPQDRFQSMGILEQALLAEEQMLAPHSTGGVETMVVRRRSFRPQPWQRWAAIGAGGSLFLLLAVWLLTRKSDPAPDKRPASAAAADMAGPSAAPLPAPKTAAATAANGAAGTGQAEKPVPAPDEPATPGGEATRPEAKPEAKPEGGKEGGGRSSKAVRPTAAAAVRLSIEPAAVNATVNCKARRVTCRGSCQVQVPDGASCMVSAPGYVSKELRYKELRTGGKQSPVRVRLSPVKFKLR